MLGNFLVDLGFIAYWAITLAGVIPDEYLFKDYDNPILSAWNWSFLPLDLAISATGLAALRRAKRGLSWRDLALVSLVLTFCSGLMAVSLWTLHGDSCGSRARLCLRDRALAAA